MRGVGIALTKDTRKGSPCCPTLLMLVVPATVWSHEGHQHPLPAPPGGNGDRRGCVAAGPRDHGRQGQGFLGSKCR
jgi:hypothetical protein